MGTWGYGPFENDCAGDFIDDIIYSKNPMKLLEKMLKKGYCCEMDCRAAAAFVQFLLKFDRRSLQRQKKLAIAALKEIRDDKDFIEAWSNPIPAKRKIDREIKNLGNTLK